MKVLSFGITQHFTDEVNWILDLAVGVQLPQFNDDSCTCNIMTSNPCNHILGMV
jgi:hypothetical protein